MSYSSCRSITSHSPSVLVYVMFIVGSGAYGAVATAFDNRLPEDKREENIVAIKKMTNAFEHKIYARRVLRELKLLRLLSHPNIIEVKTIILPKSRE